MTIVNIDTGDVLRDADGKECYIDLLSMDGEVGRKLERERNAAQMRRLRNGRDVDDEDFIAHQIQSVIKLTTGWYFGADAEQFSEDAARAFFTNPDYRWVVKQAWTFVNDSKSFIQRSSTS